MSDSQQLLASLRQQTERFLHQAISQWQMLPAAEAMASKPGPGQWSAAQCLEHLNIYGRYYLPAMERAIREAREKGQAPDLATFRSGWLGDYFTRLMRPKPNGGLKSKMKAPKNAVPAVDPDPSAMVSEFIDQQETMLRLLELAASVSLEGVRIPISIAPWIRLKLGDTFSFVIAHIERHVLQAERALAASRQLVYKGAD